MTGIEAAASAVVANDRTSLALAAGRVWPIILGGAYGLTLDGHRQGDANAAGDWLLLRDFRPSTRFARPGADATLAIRQFATARSPPEATSAAVTPISSTPIRPRLDEAFTAADAAAAQSFASRRAEMTGQAAGYWAILAPAYEAQRGVEARSTDDALFAALQGAIAVNDEATLGTARTSATDDAHRSSGPRRSHRRSRQRRAGQLLLYLSLVPVEYGRGVKRRRGHRRRSRFRKRRPSSTAPRPPSTICACHSTGFDAAKTAKVATTA